jgi:hypothetical protein
MTKINLGLTIQILAKASCAVTTQVYRSSVWIAGLAFLAAAAQASDRVLFEDEHVRFVEVTDGGGKEPSAPAAWISIVAGNAGAAPMAVASAERDLSGNVALPPNGRQQPWCQVLAAGAVGAPSASGKNSQRYYRMDFKRVDGDDFAARWREWYAWALKGVPEVADLGNTLRMGEPYSADWPFPMTYNAVTAAPANHYIRYEDADVQLLEVIARPGETENVHGHPWSSVYFDDGGGFYSPQQTTNEYPFGGTVPRGEVGRAPSGAAYPQCFAAVPQYPHRGGVTGSVLQHFFRLHFLK